jgi:glycyl-tRNA synthetase alpha subunit
VRVWVNLAAGADMEAGVGAAVDALVLEVRSAQPTKAWIMEARRPAAGRVEPRRGGQAASAQA